MDEEYQGLHTGSEIDNCVSNALLNPSGGSAGDVLKKTQSGIEWGAGSAYMFECGVNSGVFFPLAQTPTRQEVFQAFASGETVRFRAIQLDPDSQEFDYDYYIYHTIHEVHGDEVACEFGFLNYNNLDSDSGSATDQMFEGYGQGDMS